MAEDYPKTLLELEASFATEDQCRAYLAALRWPDGFVCPRCGGRKAWPAQRGRLICTACRHQATVTAGTIFQDSHLPLRLWWRALWQITSQKNGASALGLQRVLGLGSYQTAWTLRHQLRRARVRPGREQLTGRVEVDETLVGGVTPGQKGRGIPSKALVVIAAEERGEGIGRIRLARIPAGSATHLHRFIQGAIGQGSRVHTDGWKPYQGLEPLGYAHAVSRLKGQEKSAATKLLPACIGWPPCSNAGCWARIRGRLVRRIWITIWTSSPFVSIGEPPPRVASCFTAWRNKPCRSHPSRINGSWAARIT